MGNFRPRVKGKGKRWKKGHSSSSNPETKKYRDVARNRFFQDNSGEGNLTSEALKKHNAILGTKHDDESSVYDDDDGGRTFDGTLKTFKTFASNWSECSNMSFSRLLNGFRSDSAIHKEMLAVLAAVTEVIKANGGKESTVEYLGALMTTYDACESEDSVVAVLQLIGMAIKNVPSSVLKLKYAEMSKSFIDFLGKFSESDNTAILRSLIGCLSVLLRAQESAIWSSSSTLQTFDSILTFTIHPKPKVRKAAQHAVAAVLKGSCFMLEENAPDQHPAAPHVAKHLIKQLEAGGSLGGSTMTLHTLVLLKEVLSTFPKVQLKAACESILKVMTLGNMLVTSCGMQSLHGLFLSRPPVSCLPPQLNAQLITALFDYQPASSDTQPTLAWLTVMQEAYINLAKTDLALCFGNLVRLFTAVTQLLLSDRPEIMNGATLTMQAVTEDCVARACSPDVVGSYKQTLSKLFAIIEAGLSYQYHSAWHQVLHILTVWFRVAGDSCNDFMIRCLKVLGELRDSYKFANINELEFALGQAIRSMGPEVVLSAIPLQITVEECNYEFKRSWLLPVLKQNISSSKLLFFLHYFLPLATVCKKQSAAMNAKNDMIGAHSYDLLQTQIWALLPCFCNNPSDLKDVFKQIAKVLGTAISEYKELRLDTMTALRKLIASSQEAGNQENVHEMARFAKNYLPILFNLYTTKPVGTDEEGQRLATYETIKVYLHIADTNLCYDLFDRALQKLGTDDVEPFVKESVFDLLRALLPYADASRVSALYESCKPRLSNAKNHHEQKKTYKVLEELCGSNSEGCKTFLQENLSSVQDALINSLSTSAAPSKGPRLRCLIHLVRKLDKSQLDVLKCIVPEAVLCCKDINERCRSSAYNLLVEIGEVMRKHSDASQENVIREYMGLLMAGLAGSPALASTTVLALARATHEFRDFIPLDLVQILVENICLLTTTPTREIVSSTLSFFKMFLTSFPYNVVAQEVPQIVKSIVGMTNDCKNHFRIVTRHILDRLVRKFGYDVIASLVPTSDTITHKRLNNLRKIQARKKKLHSEKDEDSDDADEELFTMKSKPRSIEEILADSEDSDMEVDEEPLLKTKKQKKSVSNTWIEEKEDDIVDFTDTTAAKKITATNPATQKVITVKKKKSCDFKVAADGRLIITDNDDDNATHSNGRPRKNLASDSDDDEDDDDIDKVSVPQIGEKRKRRLSISTDATGVSQPALKYQAGGSGIHRPTKQGPGTSGAKYRAKKARGDVKKKGKPDPYAYVPLSRKMLNRRKKKKQIGQFANVCQAARKGAQKGSHLRKKITSKRR